MRFTMLTTGLVAAASLRRFGQEGVLRAHRVYPDLQHGDTYDSDFAHDDTEHPADAIKVNIKESDEKLREAEATMKTMEGKLAAAKKAEEAAQGAYQKQADETAHAQEMVTKYNASLTGIDAIKASIETAKSDLDAALARLNTTDGDATAAAEAIKAADQGFHDANLLVVEAKENATVAQDEVKGWEAKVEGTHTANVSFAEWTQKLNASQAGADALVADLTTAKADYDKVHAHSKASEARLSEAQKLFDVDKEQYEQLVGPYHGPDGTEKDEPDEWRWWDIFAR